MSSTSTLRISPPLEAKSINPWFYHKDATIQPLGIAISRQYVDKDGKTRKQRLPSKYIRAIVKTEEDAKNLAMRLNGKDPAAEAARTLYHQRVAWISPELISDYHNKIRNNYSNDKDFSTVTGYLHDYVLDFFVNKLKEPDVRLWKAKQDLWGSYLLNKDIAEDDPLRLMPIGKFFSKKVIKYIVNEANRFLRFVHNRMPLEVPYIKLEPLDKTALTNAEARRLQAHGKKHEGVYITSEKLARIVNRLWEIQLKEAWAKAALLAYAYGLRTSETVGQNPSNIKSGYLLVEYQFVAWAEDNDEKILKSVKDREPRKIPHWVLSKRETYELIVGINEAKVTAEKASEEFTDLTSELFASEGLSFHLKDLRKTWCTNMLKTKSHEAVRLAAGHADIKTTLGFYVEDGRELDDETYIPE